jgi:hypothetical protein
MLSIVLCHNAGRQIARTRARRIGELLSDCGVFVGRRTQVWIGRKQKNVVIREHCASERRARLCRALSRQIRSERRTNSVSPTTTTLTLTLVSLSVEIRKCAPATALSRVASNPGPNPPYHELKVAAARNSSSVSGFDGRSVGENCEEQSQSSCRHSPCCFIPS